MVFTGIISTFSTLWVEFFLPLLIFPNETVTATVRFPHRNKLRRKSIQNCVTLDLGFPPFQVTLKWWWWKVRESPLKSPPKNSFFWCFFSWKAVLWEALTHENHWVGSRHAAWGERGTTVQIIKVWVLLQFIEVIYCHHQNHYMFLGRGSFQNLHLWLVIWDGFWYPIPDARCMEYLPIFTIYLTQM